MKSLTRFFIVFCACNALALVAYAGPEPISSGKDMKEVATQPECFSWSGFYVGFNAGYGWSDIHASEDPFGVTGILDISPNSVTANADGAFIGGQLGYNWEFHRFVVGIEGDFDGASIEDTSEVVFPSLIVPDRSTDAFSAHERIDWLASIRGRAGVALGSNCSWLLYVTGGVAFESLSTDASLTAETAPAVFGQVGTDSFSETRTGFVVGGGVEVAIARKWTLRGEYLFYDFENSDSSTLTIPNTVNPPNGAVVRAGSNNVNSVRVALSYWFGK